MKRQSLLFIAGGLMALASCTSEPAATGNDMSQAQIDSAVNARVEEMRIEMMASNDSFINEMALYKADSMCAAMKGKTVSKPRPTASKPTVKSDGEKGTTMPNMPVNPKEGKLGGQPTTNKEDKLNQTTESKAEAARKKEEKLNR
jgi:hypothetical protein